MKEIKESIGTYNEKTLHSALKKRFEPDESFHEVKYKNHIADVKHDNVIYEIQSAQFYRLRKKIGAFTEDCKLFVVYPVPHVKKIVWVTPETGEMTKPRKSTRTGTKYDIFRELYSIRDLLDTPNLNFVAVLTDIIEYRYLCGWSADRKKGSVRAERIPESIVSEAVFSSPEDYAAVLPDDLPEKFTVKDLVRCTGIKTRLAQYVISVLRIKGIIKSAGKSGRCNLYERATSLLSFSSEQ